MVMHFKVMQIVNSIPKQRLWTNEVLPQMDESRFKSMTRCSHPQFQQLLSMIQGDPIFHDKNHRQLPVAVQLAVTLYRVGSYGQAASIRNIGTLFGLGDGSTITRITRRVIKVCT